MNKKSYTHMFRAGLYKFGDAFDVFEVSYLKVFLYFVIINLMMLLPLSISIMGMEDFDYARYGVNFTTTEIPDWIPSELPTSCEINFDRLNCGVDYIYEWELTNRERTFNVFFNVPDDQVYTEDDTIIFRTTYIEVRMNGGVLRLTYSGFNGTVFENYEDMTPEQASADLGEKFFQSLKRVVVLPLMLLAVGALFIMNLILVLSISGLSMLFRFNQSEFPCYKNMIKLFMIASTIPAILSLILGFAGMSAFTSLTYNFITPIIAWLMYRSSRIKREINS